MSVSFLLVSCCLELTRTKILSEVVSNLCEQAPELKDRLIVFDNASTDKDAISLLKNNFRHVYRSNKNVGYWSAIDWWLTTLEHQIVVPEYTYIIESDMIHYDFNKIWMCANYLDRHPDVGSIRLHEYSFENRRLYDKDNPLPNSKRSLWQSHTNKVTGERIKFNEGTNGIYETNFLTQLPALNRYTTMRSVFNVLKSMSDFSELDFQKLYHNIYSKTAILDGGIFHCNLNNFETKTLTGSWSPHSELTKFGYQRTRQSTIAPRDQYTVTRV